MRVTYEPQPFLIIDSPEQLKAFTDPLRLRVFSILTERAATNQQIADTLEQPHARVLHHVRSLLDSGLIVLVDQQIKGGNVEKYYRAVARIFGLRPGPELRRDVILSEVDAFHQEVAASTTLWPEQPAHFETRLAHLSDARLAEFHRRFLDLLTEYWGGLRRSENGELVGEPPVAEPDAPARRFFAAIYFDPSGPATGAPR